MKFWRLWRKIQFQTLSVPIENVTTVKQYTIVNSEKESEYTVIEVTLPECRISERIFSHNKIIRYTQQCDQNRRDQYLTFLGQQDASLNYELAKINNYYEPQHHTMHKLH